MEDKKEKYILFGANCIVDWIKEHDFYDIQGLNENTIDEDLYKDCLYFLNILNYLNITIPKHNSYGDYYGMFNSENYYKYNEDSLEILTKVFYNNKKDFKKIIKPIEKLNVILGNELATAYLEKNLDLENAYKMVINNSNKLDNEKLIGYIKKHVSLSLKRNIENNNYYGLKYEEYNFLIEYLQESLEFENIRMFINIKSIEDYDNLSLNTFTNATINDIIKDVNENNLELLVKWLYDRESDYFVVNNKNLDKLNTILGDKEKTECFIQSKDLENSFKGIKNYGENVYIEGIKKLNEDFNNNSIKEIKKPVWTRDLIKEKMYDELLKIIENNNYYYVNLDTDEFSLLPIIKILEFENTRKYIELDLKTPYEVHEEKQVTHVIKLLNGVKFKTLFEWLYDKEGNYFVVNDSNIEKLNTILGNKEATDCFIETKNLEKALEMTLNYEQQLKNSIRNILNEFNRIVYLSIKINNYYDDFEDPFPLADS